MTSAVAARPSNKYSHYYIPPYDSASVLTRLQNLNMPLNLPISSCRNNSLLLIPTTLINPTPHCRIPVPHGDLLNNGLTAVLSGRLRLRAYSSYRCCRLGLCNGLRNSIDGCSLSDPDDGSGNRREAGILRLSPRTGDRVRLGLGLGLGLELGLERPPLGR